jgi:predicted O-linked N-acetylglucosamine transferase (SPINDLY family)
MSIDKGRQVGAALHQRKGFKGAQGGKLSWTGTGKSSVTTAAEKLKEALALHQQGKFVEAEKRYEDILLAQPDQFDALHLLGTLLHQAGKTERGVELIGKAIAINPKVAAAHSNLGIGLKHLGRLDEALLSYDRAIELAPDHADAHFNRGNALYGLKRIEEAVASYDKAVALRPDHAETCFNRADALRDLKRLEDALVDYDKAVALKPDYAEAYATRGLVLTELDRLEDAVASYDKAIALKPDLAVAWSNRGNVLKELGRRDDALASHDRAIELRPFLAEMHRNRGLVLADLRRLDEAMASHDRAIALKADYSEAYASRANVLYELRRFEDAVASFDKAIALNTDDADAFLNRGNALKDLKRLGEALTSYDKAIALDSGHADARVNRSLCLLLLGRLQEAWPEYEWRQENGNWKAGRPCPAVPYRLWHDEDIAGRTVLVSAEQGLGDTLQFCRYLKLLEGKRARVIAAVQPGLRSIVSTLSPSIEVLVPGEAVPAADYYCPLLSLTLAFATTVENIPAEVPYLKADPQRVESWRQRIGSEGLRIGIAWQGRPTGPADADRSFALSEFAEIGKLPGVRLISLQKNFGSEQLARLPAGMKVETLGEDFDAGPEAFLDTAAVMESLDLVITSDTAIAHLAGALGRPVWVALKWVPDWRWLLDRSDSPWYPTMRLFRQSSRGDWTGAFRAMRDELAVRTGAGKPAATTTAEKLQEALASHQQGKFVEAENLYEDILLAQPDQFDALHLLGTLLHQTGKTERGVDLIGRAIAINPTIAAAHSNLGIGLKHLGRLDEALNSYDKAIELNPDYAEAFANRGNVLKDLKRIEEAVASYDKAVALRPDRAETYFNRANALRDLKRLEDALVDYDNAVALKPDYEEAYATRGLVLTELDRLGDAVASYDKAVALKPDFAVTWSNRGNVLKALGHLGNALTSYDKAIALDSGHADARVNKSLCLLLLGRLQEAWPEYEWRKENEDWKTRRPCPSVPYRAWRRDEDIAGKTVLVSAEQGLGDTLQFCRYLKLLEARGARVVVAVQAGLRAIVSTLSPSIEVLVPGEAVPAADYHCPLLSLPLAFGTMLESIPAEVPYLQAQPERIERWRQRIGSEGFRIGIAWQGRLDGRMDARRSFAVAALEEIGRLDGVRLISLQKNFGSEQLARLPSGMKVETLGEDYDAGPDAFLDTAAVMESLDLVITPDTAIAHLAGALGRPVWVALKWVPDWRWLLDRSDSPWYPTMRLFRQAARGDWTGVFRAMRDELAGRTGAGGAVRTAVASTQGGSLQQVQARLAQALALHQAGELQGAQAIYREILKVQPDHFDSLHLSGVIACQTGDLELGVRLIGGAVRVNPDVASAYYNRANALLKLKRAEEALENLDKALSLQPDYPEAHFSRGNALMDLKRQEKALASYNKALSQRPDYVAAYNNRGNALKELKRLDEAVASFDSAVALNPDYAEAHCSRGSVLNDLERYAEAMASYDEALSLKPGYVEAWRDRGNALLGLKRPAEALASYDQAISLNPTYAEAHNNRAGVLHGFKRLEEAVVSYDKAVALNPGYADAHYNRGIVLQALRRPDEALASYDRAIALRPDHAVAHNNRAAALRSLKRFEEALTSYDKALSLKPDYADASTNRGNVLLDLKRLDEASASYERALSLKPEYEFLLGTWLHTRMMLCDWSSLTKDLRAYEADIRAARRVTAPFPAIGLVGSLELQKMVSGIYAEAKYPAGGALGPIRKRPTDGKIRIGYYSADFHNHATAYLMAELFEAHDAGKFELHGFSFGPDWQDEMRRRVSAAFHKFIDVRDRSDLEVARMSRELGIDIAVDLKGYTQDSRPGIFAERCAPVQVNWLGYPGTMAADWIDYIVADRTVIPEESKSCFTEKVVYLPHSYQVNDSKRKISDRVFTRQELGLPEQGFVFCCFNNNYKILPATFEGWMRMLRAVEGSVLWLLEDNPTAARNLRKEAAARGVDSARLVFARRLALDEHLARHRLADLFLDTLPCNAHTTASDALWAGLPVLTCLGRSFAGRVAASLLKAVGLPELITNAQLEYETTAIALARDPLRLGELKNRLATNRSTSSLFNGRLFARHIEAAYQAMHARYQAGMPPDIIETQL